MEDLDGGRVIAGCAERMLRTLEAFGFAWDGAVEYQSERLAHYAAGLESLRARGLTFECSCTRRDRVGEIGYPGNCRGGPRRPGPTATRLRIDERAEVTFADRAQGSCHFALGALGDVVVRRRDGIFAYQLAVVVDDAWQGVTDVVRGADLLDNTPWQMTLQRALGLPTPSYAHLPLIVESHGGKLAKSRRSLAIEPELAGSQLHQALTLLRQAPPLKLKLEPASVVLAWARAHWDLDRLRGVRQVPYVPAESVGSAATD